MGERRGRDQGTCIKDPWIKPKGGRIDRGRGGIGQERVEDGKWKQLYLNNNEKNRLIINNLLNSNLKLKMVYFSASYKIKNCTFYINCYLFNKRKT